MPRQNILLCYPFEQKRIEKWLKKDNYFYVQPKLDGDRMIANIHSDRVQLLSSEGNDRNYSLPHIVEELEKNIRIFHARGIYTLDGEAYNHELSFEEIRSITSRTKNLHTDHTKINFHVFDHDVPYTYFEDRYAELTFLPVTTFSNSYVRLVPSNAVRNLQEFYSAYKNFLSLGYEGIIARNRYLLYEHKRSTNILKYKPKKKDSYRIVAILEEQTIYGEPKDIAGSILLSDPEGNQFSVSAGMNDEEKKLIWENRDSLIGTMAEVHYQATTSSGVPKFATDIKVKI
jgi:ATP-dependent DNA ligase